MRRTLPAILVSLVVHAALFLCLRFSSSHSRDARIAPVEEVPITFEVRRPERLPEAAESAVPPAEATEHPLLETRRSRRIPAYPSPSPPPAPAKPAALPAEENPTSSGALGMRTDGSLNTEKPALDLYRPDSIERSLPPGSTGQPSAPAGPPSKDVASEKGEARVAKWLREAFAEASTRNGDVPPIWRDIQRRIEETFHPPRYAVSDAPTLGHLGRQLLSTGRPTAPEKTEVLPRELRSREANLAADVMAGQEAAARPAAWLRTEIVVEVGPDGLLRSAEIAVPSGRGELDKLALEAVRAAVAEHPITGGCRRASPCTTRTRWAVESAIRVEPPPVMVSANGKTGGPGGITPFVLRFFFDETKGKARRARAFANEVKTRIKLLSIE